MAKKKRTQATCGKCHMAYELGRGYGYAHHARVSLIHHAALKTKKNPSRAQR